MAGKLIVIEGSDGTGKGTQSKILVKRLKEEGREAEMFDFPQYDDFFGKMIASYLNNEFGDATKVDPYLTSMLYAADRWKASAKIRDALDNDKVVVVNRYVPSSMAHQGSKSQETGFIEWLEELEYEQFGIPRPDKVIVLTMPAEVSQGLVDSKSAREYTEKGRDGHEADRSYLKKVIDTYKKLSEKKGWDLIECYKDRLLSREEVSEKIWEKVNPLL
ncbi:MAG: dTMP kinase [Nanobdellota archaeon]